MALAAKRGQARLQGNGMLAKLAVVALLCIVVALSAFQSNQSLLGGATLALRGGAAAGDGGSGTDAATADAAAGASQEQDTSPVENPSNSKSGTGSSDTGAAKEQQPGSDAGSSAAPTDSVQAAETRSDGKPLLFFDVGGAYHHLPTCPPGWEKPGFACDAFPCPVAWQYIKEKDKADVVIYNTLDGMAGWAEASSRPAGQQVVMFAMESGQYYPAIYTAKEHGANITADYRLDSDVPVTYYTPWEYPDLKLMPVPFAKKRTDGLVAVFISNCGPRNDREQVLARLMELLPGLVHSYGGCQHNMQANATKLETFSTYKFAFTPENSNDPGYVTEKIYHGLLAGTVPIYIGAPDVARFVPAPEALVRVADFNSTEELADYIKKAAEDESIYSKHIAWKQRPESEWSKDWKALQRLTQYSAHCRIAMHVAGRPHKWRE